MEVWRIDEDVATWRYRVLEVCRIDEGVAM
jgi:hypothetical protein